MTTQELLKPRYKVIADFPGSPFNVGEVYSAASFIVNPEQYPHLFKKLAWYEERDVKDLPKHVRWSDSNVYEVWGWRSSPNSGQITGAYVNDGSHVLFITDLIPADKP